MVEGSTVEEALALVYSKLVREHDLEFDVLHTDITAGEDMTVKYIADRIREEIAGYLRKHPFIVKEDILIACVDGLTGFLQAIEAVFPDTEKQQCIIHQI